MYRHNALGRICKSAPTAHKILFQQPHTTAIVSRLYAVAQPDGVVSSVPNKFTITGRATLPFLWKCVVSSLGNSPPQEGNYPPLRFGRQFTDKSISPIFPFRIKPLRLCYNINNFLQHKEITFSQSVFLPES